MLATVAGFTLEQVRAIYTAHSSLEQASEGRFDLVLESLPFGRNLSSIYTNPVFRQARSKTFTILHRRKAERLFANDHTIPLLTREELEEEAIRQYELALASDPERLERYRNAGNNPAEIALIVRKFFDRGVSKEEDIEASYMRETAWLEAVAKVARQHEVSPLEVFLYWDTADSLKRELFTREEYEISLKEHLSVINDYDRLAAEIVMPMVRLGMQENPSYENMTFEEKERAIEEAGEALAPLLRTFLASALEALEQDITDTVNRIYGPAAIQQS